VSEKVKHWPNGYEHVHLGVTTLDALRTAMRCSRHQVSNGDLVTMASILDSRGRFKFEKPGERPENFDLVPHGRGW